MLDRMVQKANVKNVVDIKIEILKVCDAVAKEAEQAAIAQFPRRLLFWIDTIGYRFEYKM